MRSETLPEEYATDAILAIDYDRWETVGVVDGECGENDEMPRHTPARKDT